MMGAPLLTLSLGAGSSQQPVEWALSLFLLFRWANQGSEIRPGKA